jgi:hypothetical protein
MSDRRPYSRIYWTVLEDAKFDAIRSDMRHFGSWSLMLVIADMAYPAPAFIPPTVPKASLAALVDASLVDLLPARMYRIHGLQTERERRAAAATRDPRRHPPAPQPGPKRDPEGEQDETKAETRQSRDETDARAVGVDDDEARVFAFLARHGAAIREDAPLGRRLLGLIERRGTEDVLRRAGQMAKANGAMSDRQWVLGLENAIEAIPTPKEARTADVEEESRKHAERVQAEMHARRVERFRFTGEWDEAYGPRPEAATA